MWHQKYSFPCAKGLDFVSCIVILKVISIGADDCSWGDVKTNKSGKISAISIDVSEKYIIVYTSACIESARIEHNNSGKNIDDNYSSHTWKEDIDKFDQQIEKWGVKNYFQMNQNLFQDT